MDTSTAAVARMVADFRVMALRPTGCIELLEALARERDELQRERERTVRDLKPLHDLVGNSGEAWGGNVCEWAAKRISALEVSLRIANDLLPRPGYVAKLQEQRDALLAALRAARPAVAFLVRQDATKEAVALMRAVDDAIALSTEPAREP